MEIDYVERIRQEVLTNIYPPVFDRSKWEEIYSCRNCFAYALDIKQEEIIPVEFFQIPGRMLEEEKRQQFLKKKEPLALKRRNVDSNIRLAPNVIWELILLEIEELGMQFRYVDINEILEEGEYRIAFCVGNRDCHFLRQDKDGTWSHKMGDNKPTRLDFSGYIINNPYEANLGRYQVQFIVALKQNKT